MASQATNGSCIYPGQLPLNSMVERILTGNGLSTYASSISFIAEEQSIWFLSFRPSLNEMLVLLCVVFAAMAKLAFSMMLIAVIAFPGSALIVVDNNFNGKRYVVYVALFLIISISSAINALLLLTSRMEETFFERPDVLRCHIILDAIAILLHLVVFFLFYSARLDDNISKSISTVFGLLLLLDICKSMLLMLFQYTLKGELTRFIEDIEY